MKSAQQKRHKQRLVKSGIAFLIVIAGSLSLILKLKLHPVNAQNQPTLSIEKASISSTDVQTSSPLEMSIPQPNTTLTLEQEVGQLIMVGMPADNYNQATLDAISHYYVGNVILTGRSYLDIPETKKITELLQNLAPNNLKLLIACDQEGGNVQVLRGKDFSAIPTGRIQGTWSAESLQQSAQIWGNELAQAGINFNLAPVADSVPSATFARKNAPIGYWHREYSYDPETTVSHADAFYKGMRAANILTTAKHFPSLGNVTGNTDTTANVIDRHTSADSNAVTVFKRLIDNGTPSIMTATAIYTQIDPTLPGAFSPKMVQELLRSKLGFDGLVITDDLSNARQVQAWPPGERATLALAAGNDIILAGEPTHIPEMVLSVVAKAQAEPEFAEKIHQAAARVLKIKQQLKLAQ